MVMFCPGSSSLNFCSALAKVGHTPTSFNKILQGNLLIEHSKTTTLAVKIVSMLSRRSSRFQSNLHHFQFVIQDFVNRSRLF